MKLLLLLNQVIFSYSLFSKWKVKKLSLKWSGNCHMVCFCRLKFEDLQGDILNHMKTIIVGVRSYSMQFVASVRFSTVTLGQ